MLTDSQPPFSLSPKDFSSFVCLFKRITITYRINTLTEPETTGYIKYRLKVAGMWENSRQLTELLPWRRTITLRSLCRDTWTPWETTITTKNFLSFGQTLWKVIWWQRESVPWEYKPLVWERKTLWSRSPVRKDVVRIGELRLSCTLVLPHPVSKTNTAQDPATSNQQPKCAMNFHFRKRISLPKWNPLHIFSTSIPPALESQEISSTITISYQ